MKAQKVTITIKVELLSIDALPCMLTKLESEITNEFENGQLTANDGDTIKWTTERKDVEF